MNDDRLLAAYIESRHRLETLGEPRAVVFASTLTAMIRVAPCAMSSKYRAASSIGLRELLMKFDGREVPAAIFDHARFKKLYKGLEPAKTASAIAADEATIQIPSAVFSTDTAAIYKPIAAAIERERTAVAAAFQKGTYADDDEIYWLAAEIDSKLEATAELTEYWCDRLEAAAISADLASHKIWLIAPVGFSDEAIEVLSARKAFGSARAQAEQLRSILAGDTAAAAKDDRSGTNAVSYEIVIPMGDETELIAAHTFEEIARRHEFRAQDINQVKTALVEACINAAEHSHSPDRRIRLAFDVRPGSVTINVANRGLRLTDAERPAADSPRRGWGLKLIEKLMDDVRIESTDDGTSLSMTKLFATGQGDS
jgi:serine/threonine-protein kinase RsbW